MALAIAFSSSAARLCTMPIQFPETCTTARWLSMRTRRACCDSNMRVEGSSRLARICCQSSPRSSVWAGVAAASCGCGSVAESVAAGAVGAGAAGVGGAWAADVSGRLTPAEVADVRAGVGAAAGVGTAVEEAGGAAVALTGAGDGDALTVAVAGSASRPSSSTSSHRRGCTL